MVVMAGLMHHHRGSCKTRKRGCSSSASSTSSRVNNHRPKRTILLGSSKGKGGSRSITPVPAWRLTPSLVRSTAIESPNSRPVSARKLAATLWEMNEMPSPRKSLEKRLLQREKQSVQRSYVPTQLSDPSRSPVSERINRSGTGGRLMDNNVGVLETRSTASLMEIETRSRGQTPRGSVTGLRNQLKDISNALTTSKELLKIINRIWSNADQLSSNMPLIAALHAEFERARLQVNRLIQEQHSEQTEVSYLVKCFTEEKAALKHRQHRAVEAAVESIAGELEVEKKLRRRFEGLNKKLGQELAETKAAFMKARKELETEKRAREVMEQVCDEIARDVGEERVEVDELKKEMSRMEEEAEKEREMLKLADMLREERVQLKLSDAKHHLEEKNASLEKLRKQLEVSLKSRGGNHKGFSSRNNLGNGSEELAAFLSKAKVGSFQDEESEKNETEVGDIIDGEEDSAESDLHSIELKMDNDNKRYEWAYKDVIDHESKQVLIDNEIERGRLPRKSSYLQRSISGGVQWGLQTENPKQFLDQLHRNRLNEMEAQPQRKSYDEVQKYKPDKEFRNRISYSPRLSMKDFGSPTRQWGHPWSSQDPGNSLHERPIALYGGGMKSRLADVTGEGGGSPARRSKR